jgi:hypothetical protein
VKRIEKLKDSLTQGFEDMFERVDPTWEGYEETLDQTNRAKRFLQNYQNSEALRVSETSPAHTERKWAQTDKPTTNRRVELLFA